MKGTDTDGDDREVSLSRRRLLAGTGTLLAGGSGMTALLSGGTDRAAAAEIEVADLNVSGDSATLTQPPAEITLEVSGSWEIDAGGPLEQARVIMQVHHDGEAAELAEDVAFENLESGEYRLVANLLEHPAITAKSVFPEAVDETVETPIEVRMILLAVRDQNPVAETAVEDTATVTVARGGMTLTVTGEGNVSIVTPGESV